MVIGWSVNSTATPLHTDGSFDASAAQEVCDPIMECESCKTDYEELFPPDGRLYAVFFDDYGHGERVLVGEERARDYWIAMRGKREV